MKKFFLYYNEKANINYSFLFCLYCIAERNQKERIDNIISYNNQKELIDRIKEKCGYTVSTASVSRILNDEQYLPYFSKSKEENKIVLHNNFKKGITCKNKFVILTEKEILFLLKHDNKQLCKYYLYLKYYCGFSKNKSIDTTANQILSAIGYSANCGNNKDNLCKYNKLLLETGFVSI